MKRKIVLFDMDGTVADYDGQLIEDLNKIKSPMEPEITRENLDIFINTRPHLEARRHVITAQKGWFRNLPTFELGMDIYREAVAIGYTAVVCTKGPNSKPAAWTEKLEWCQAHEEFNASGVTIVSDKSIVYGRVLVDDFPDYILGWLEYRPRGIAIMPAHPKNAHFTHPNVVRYDGTNIEEVRDALQKAFDRE